MTRKIFLRPEAEVDLASVWEYTVETWSRAQAERYLHDIGEVFLTLANFPELARLRPEFDPPVRIHTFRKHVIIYVFDDTTIEVIRVVHGRTNWAVYLATE
ncbi:type II toxin-antitoxin system RelE/ParE family toxin [Litoreibacter roseus]|uniref:Toxin n=1 Tax=Litoreibacter roseus TaxID=2601869 RepID=A0A6N6JMD4_9RHOB|nr:type II toxin-antitoxin system RelE/ParE family toxin [Litoreibacter roseus]GFE67265.1 plasmid stabilization protein ParE [Litoreibacter roseus]